MAPTMRAQPAEPIPGEVGRLAAQLNRASRFLKRSGRGCQEGPRGVVGKGRGVSHRAEGPRARDSRLRPRFRSSPSTRLGCDTHQTGSAGPRDRPPYHSARSCRSDRPAFCRWCGESSSARSFHSVDRARACRRGDHRVRHQAKAGRDEHGGPRHRVLHVKRVDRRDLKDAPVYLDRASGGRRWITRRGGAGSSASRRRRCSLAS